MKRWLRAVGCLAVASAACLDVGPDDQAGSARRAVSVTWTNVVKVTASGDDLAKSDPGGRWDAGAVSVESLAADGYVQFTTAEATTAKMAGLGNGDASRHYGDIEFAVYLKANGAVAVKESGVPRGTFGTYSAGDVFRVEVERGVVSYEKNGTTFYTSTVTPTFPLVVDTSLLTDGATIQDVALVPTRPTWQNLVGLAVADGTLTKAGPGGWNAGASSVEALAGDGFVEFAAGENTTARVAGLSQGDSDRGYADIDYGVYLKANGVVAVYEGGVLRGTNFGTYAAGDRFRVAVDGGVVRYSKNGAAPFYTSAVAPTLPLLVDTSFYTPGATLRDFTLTEAADTCPSYDGGGASCDGSFTVENEFDLAEIASCAEITGNLVISAPGMTTIALPNLERVGGTLSVGGNNSSLVKLLLPQLKEVAGPVRLYPAPATVEVDLSRLHTSSTFESGQDAPGLYLPCLVSLSEHLSPASPVTAPLLATVAGNVNMYTGPVPPQPLSAPRLTEIGGVLAYTDEMDLPLLTRVGGLIAKGRAPSDHPRLVHLPSLRQVDRMLVAGTTWDGDDEQRVYCFSGATRQYSVSFPSLEQVGSLLLCTRPAELEMPQLRFVTGPPLPLPPSEPIGLQLGPNGSSTAPALSLPALEEITGKVNAYRSIELPVLSRIDGSLGVSASVTAPSLQEATGDLSLGVGSTLAAPQLAVVGGTLAFSTPVDLPLLTQVGAVMTGVRSMQEGLVTPPVDLPSLRVVTGVLATSIGWHSSGFFRECKPSLPYTVSLPVLERVGSLILCSPPQSLDVPQLRLVTGPPFEEPGFSGTGVLTAPYPYGARPTVSIPALEDVVGDVVTQTPTEFASLWRIRGALSIWAPTTAPALQEITGKLYLGNSAQAVSLPALTSARTIDASAAGSLSTLDLPALSTTTGTATGYSIQIGSTRLTTISMPALTALPGILEIRANPLLSSLGFPLLASIGPTLVVRNNKSLPTCYATDLLAQLQAAGWTGTWTIQGNNDGGTCP